MKMAVFQGCQIVLDLSTAVKFKEKQTLRKLITDNAGVVSFIVTKKSTHVVCDNGEKAETSYKCRMAMKYGIPVISTLFLLKSVETGRLQKTDDFIVAGKSKSDTLREGKITASKYQKTDKKKAVRPFINVNGIKVWKDADNDCPGFTADYQVAKFAVFRDQKKEKSRTITSFAVIEVHVDEKFVPNHDPDLKHKYRVSTHSGLLHVLEKGGQGKVEYRFCNSVDEALTVNSHLYNLQLQKGMDLMHDVFSRLIGSEKFRQMMSELGLENTKKTESVTELIQHVWCEAQGELSDTISSRDTTIEQIDKAEAILKQIKSALDDSDDTKLNKLLTEFYSTIPHHPSKRIMTCSKKWLSRAQDLCQLIRDMLTVSEATDWGTSSSTQSKYKALRCVIEDLSQTSLEYELVEEMVTQSTTGNMTPVIKNIFSVSRPVENVGFTCQISPKKLLFHSTKAENLVGILSRGLLLPRVVVDDHGGKRTDPGMLGTGIYFASAASTSIQYSHPSDTKGTRFMLVNEVALGNTMEMFDKDLTLTSAPQGYQSVHGVKSSREMPSAFKDDEFVVYNTNQQRIKYLVEFVLPEDRIKDDKDYINLSDITDHQSEENMDSLDIDLKDVTNVTDPMTKVKPGLVSKNDAPVNLKAVHIRAKLLDLASEVVVLQEYENTSKSPLEAKYVFPLGDLAAVCGFEAFINGKHIVGEVKEKEKAHKEYKKAISEGHGAYLMDQDEETPDIFTVSVGNLPPGAHVLIKITYVAELQVEGELINFQLPGSVAPWKKQSLKEVTQHETETHEVEQGKTSVQVAVDMPFDIRTIECPSHKIKVKKTLTKATVEILENQSIVDGFQLLIGLAEIHVPRMWVERKEGDQSHQACMLSFYPEFEACETDDVDVVLLLDMSNSMKGDNLNNTKKVALLVLQQLPPSWNFNVVVFGTAFKEVFPGCVKKSPANVKSASQFIMNLSATMGNTEIVRPMHSFYLLKPESMTQNVFLISDGHVNNEETMMKQALDNFHHTRIFTMGVGNTANRHLLRALARVAGGSFEFFDQKAKSKWERKIKSLINKAAQPGLTSVSVDWEQHGADVPAPIQAPRQITALFSGSRQVVYGYVPNCTMATLHANIAGEEVSTLVSTSDLSITTGKILHRLTAKAIINDWEDGVLSPDKTDHEIVKMNTKDYIIELSKEYSIVTQFTSFVAIEKRDKDDEKATVDAPSMSELVERENVDELAYIGYEEEQKTDMDMNKSIEEILTNVRLNFDSKDKQLEFLREGFQLIDQISDEDESIQNMNQLEDAFFDWDLSEKFDFTQEFGYKPRRLLITLTISTLTGRNFTINAETTSTVSQIKTMIRDKEGKPEDAQRLIFDGRQVEDSKTLQDLDIQNMSKIFLLERLRGGGPGPAEKQVETKERTSFEDELFNKKMFSLMDYEETDESKETTDELNESTDSEVDTEPSDSNFDGEEEESSGEESSEEMEEEGGKKSRIMKSSVMRFEVESAPISFETTSLDITEAMQKTSTLAERENNAMRGSPKLLESHSASIDMLDRIFYSNEVYASEISDALSSPASALKPCDHDYDTSDSELEAELEELMQETLDCEVLMQSVEAEAVSIDACEEDLIFHHTMPSGVILMAEEEESEDDMAFGLFDDDIEIPVRESHKVKEESCMALEREKSIPEFIEMDADVPNEKKVYKTKAKKISLTGKSGFSPLSARQDDLFETQEILTRNIDQVLEHREKLDQLVKKSEKLSTQTLSFSKKATSLPADYNGGGGNKKKLMLLGAAHEKESQARLEPPPPPPCPPVGSFAFGKTPGMPVLFGTGHQQGGPVMPPPPPASFSFGSWPEKDLGGLPQPPPARPGGSALGKAPGMSASFGAVRQQGGSFTFSGAPVMPPPPPESFSFGSGPKEDLLGGLPPPPPALTRRYFASGGAPSRPGKVPLLLPNDETISSCGVGFFYDAPPVMDGVGAPTKPSGSVRQVLLGDNSSSASSETEDDIVNASPPMPVCLERCEAEKIMPPLPRCASRRTTELHRYFVPSPAPFGAPPPVRGKVHGGLSFKAYPTCSSGQERSDTTSLLTVPVTVEKEKPRFTDTRETESSARAKKPVSWRSVGPVDKGYEGSATTRRGDLLSSIKQGKQLKKAEPRAPQETSRNMAMFVALSKRRHKEDPEIETPLLDDFSSLGSKPQDQRIDNRYGLQADSHVELSTYGIGVDIPYICTGTLDHNKKDEFMSWILSSQSKEGFWEVHPGSQLEVTLKIDIAVVEQVLKGAGLSSLGMSVHRDITRLVSSIIVVLSVLKICLPDRVPMDFNDQSVSKIVLKNLLDAVAYQGDKYVEMVKKAFEFGEEVDKSRPLVCSTLEMGSNWILVVAKMMGLHREGTNISDKIPRPYDGAVMPIEVV